MGYTTVEECVIESKADLNYQLKIIENQIGSSLIDKIFLTYLFPSQTLIRAGSAGPINNIVSAYSYAPRECYFL